MANHNWMPAFGGHDNFLGWGAAPRGSVDATPLTEQRNARLQSPRSNLPGDLAMTNYLPVYCERNPRSYEILLYRSSL